MPDNSKSTGAAVEAHYQFLAWLIPVIEKFPKAHKFTLGDRIVVTALDVLEALIEATYTRERTLHLRQANLGIEKLPPKRPVPAPTRPRGAALPRTPFQRPERPLIFRWSCWRRPPRCGAGCACRSPCVSQGQALPRYRAFISTRTPTVIIMNGPERFFAHPARP